MLWNVIKYRFPCSWNRCDSLRQQAEYIHREAVEAMCAADVYGIERSDWARQEMLMEAMDCIHAAETMIRMSHAKWSELFRCWRNVIRKNRERGYYDKERMDA